MKKIAIVSNFSSNFQAYSLCIVNERYISMLVNNGYHVKFICMEGFKKEGVYDHPLVEICYTPRVQCHNEWQKQKQDPNFEKDIKMLKEKLTEYLKDCNVAISHDIFFQAAMERYDVACRQIAKERPDLRWLHLVHSATSQKDHSEKFPNSFIIYPNTYDIPRVAKAFGFEEPEVKCVPHAIDICSFFDMHEYSREIINKYDILNADVIMTYPLRLDRGKQPEMNIKIASALKKIGKTVKLIIMDFHSTGQDKVRYREDLKKIAIDKGLNSDEVVFISEFKKTNKETKRDFFPLSLECPRKMVKDFMEISNVFCLPSKSETFSLVAQEAMITGNFMILNFDFPPMRSIYGDKPLYRKFSSCLNIVDGTDGSTDTKYDNEDGYFLDIAKYINYELEHDRVMSMRTKARKDFNLNAVFKKYLEPLLYYEGEDK